LLALTFGLAERLPGCNLESASACSPGDNIKSVNRLGTASVSDSYRALIWHDNCKQPNVTGFQSHCNESET
jgi:hypothetical protein